MTIHPTAIVSPQAFLAADVTIGPYTVIEAGARIGQGCEIGAHVVISGHVAMGAGNRVHAGSVIGGEPHDLGFQKSTPSEVLIGSGNEIREHCTIHRSTVASGQTRIGNDCFLMAGSHVAHDCILGNRVIMANGAMLGGHCRIADSVFVGGGAAVHQFVRIGRMALCQGNSAITKSLPPFCIAAGINRLSGLNVVGLRRAGISAAVRGSIKAAFDLVFRRGLNVTQALEASHALAWEAEALEFLEFIRDPGKRGIPRLRNSKFETEPG